LKDLPFGKNLSYGFEMLPLFPKPLLAAGRQRWRGFNPRWKTAIIF